MYTYEFYGVVTEATQQFREYLIMISLNAFIIYFCS